MERKSRSDLKVCRKNCLQVRRKNTTYDIKYYQIKKKAKKDIYYDELRI